LIYVKYRTIRVVIRKGEKKKYISLYWNIVLKEDSVPRW